MTRHELGNALPSLLILIALIGGVGAWNYHKNLALDEQEYRPRYNPALGQVFGFGRLGHVLAP